MIKAIFFDIDGTLISFKTRKITDAVIEALHKAQKNGIRLFICSGRPPMHLSLLDDAFNAFPWDGYVMFNGQCCMGADREPFYEKTMPVEALESLVPWLKEHADFCCTFHEKTYSYDLKFNQRTYNYLSSIGKLDRMTPVDDPVRALTHPTYMICPYIPEEMDAEFISHAPGLKSARWTPDFADVIPADGGKDVGLQKMLDRFGITQEESMAFGDGGNDISMLDYVSLGVAMGNANDIVKSHADYITDECDQDGVVSALKHFRLID
ncbi:MAG: Cof-type HAD-IIB family hydrolase [Erysipelotrichaceae bacterium]|nr:Cof-type HAD-IIB family hydrolase [Erysipelotrichaceae bacterium]